MLLARKDKVRLSLYYGQSIPVSNCSFFACEIVRKVYIWTLCFH